MVTEVELAVGFVSIYARAAVGSVGTGDGPDDVIEYLRYCGSVEREPTQERLDLARDSLTAVRELLGYEDEEDMLLPDEVLTVSMRELRDRLECYGWRLGFLTRPALF